MSATGTYLNCLYGAEPDGAYVELRWRLRTGRGMGREFVAVRDPRLADVIQARGRETDLYVGVAPRRRLEGTRAAVERCHALFVDCDTPESIAALDAFRPSPSMVVNSGHGKHGYWSLWPPVGPDELEHANRRLARALGADMRATDAARILRPPGTFNHKSGAPVAVTLERLEVEVYTAEQVTGGLPDPPDSRAREDRASGAVRPLSAVTDPLASIDPPTYIAALTGREVGRDGKVSCPFHDDRTPSLHAYPTVERGWCCHAGCGGGTIIDFGAKLYGLEPRGAGYHEIRHRLEADLRARAAA